MTEISAVVLRNCKIFLRDKMAVFFSLLSTIIILGLMVIFLGKINSDALVETLSEFPARNTDVDRINAVYLIQLWTFAGITVVNSITVTFTALSILIQDETRKRLMAFYVTPANRTRLTIGYILSAWIIGILFCCLTLVIGEVYFIIQGHVLLPLSSLLKAIGIIALMCLVFSSIGYLFTLFIHSDSAWNGLLTILGTLVGFAGGIYLPLGSLADNVQTFLKTLPVLHGVAILRNVFMQETLEITFQGLPPAAMDMFKEKMGILLYYNNQEIDLSLQVVLLFIYVIISIILAAGINHKRKLKDR